VSKSEPELLPCPFCGGVEPYISEADDGLARWVCCPTCDADGPPIEWRFGGTKDEAHKIVVDAWNKRADHEDAEKWRALMKSFSRPDKMRSDVAPVWDARNVSQG
jgi:Lar family restriction alleviation protein